VWKPARSVPNAAKKQLYLSSQHKDAPSIAGNASSSAGLQDHRPELIGASRVFSFLKGGWVPVFGAQWGARRAHELEVYLYAFSLFCHRADAHRRFRQYCPSFSLKINRIPLARHFKFA